LIKYLLGRVQEIIFIGSILFQSNGDNAKALVYVNKALTWQKKPFWYNRLKSLIAKLGRWKKQNYHLQQLIAKPRLCKMNKDSIAEWVRANLLYLYKIPLRYYIEAGFFCVLFPIFSYILDHIRISTDLGNDKFNRRFADFYFEYAFCNPNKLPLIPRLVVLL
jgi:hypothetical protein